MALLVWGLFHFGFNTKYGTMSVWGEETVQKSFERPPKGGEFGSLPLGADCKPPPFAGPGARRFSPLVDLMGWPS